MYFPIKALCMNFDGRFIYCSKEKIPHILISYYTQVIILMHVLLAGQLIASGGKILISILFVEH